MKTYYQKRRPRPGTVKMAQMRLHIVNGEPRLTLTFTDKSKARLGAGFIYDACEHYLLHLIRRGMDKCPPQ